MNFLERKAANKAWKHIEPYLARGEALMDFDIGRVPAGQVAVLATNMAVYICPLPLRGEPHIAPYINMAGASRHGDRLVLQAMGGTQLVVDLGRGSRAVSDIVIHHVEQASRMRAAEQNLVDGATAATARGRYVPLLFSEQDEGGPGTFRVTDGDPIFDTDGGISHDYGWDSYKDYKRTPDGFQVNLGPESGAFILLQTAASETWSRLFSEAGLSEQSD